MSERKEPLALMACKVIMRAHVSTVAKAVGAILLDHLNWGTGRCDPGLARIAALSDYSRSAVRKAIGQLVEAGLLTVTAHGSGSSRNRYEFNWEEIRLRDHEAQAAMGFTAHGAQAVDKEGRTAADSDGGVSHTEHRVCLTRSTGVCPIHGTKPVESNPMKKPEELDAPTRARWRGRKGQAERKDHNEARPSVTLPIPRGRGQPMSEAADGAALRRWDADLRARFGREPQLYAMIVDVINPAMQAAATAAERRRRGAGLKVILARLADLTDRLSEVSPAGHQA